LALIIHYQVFRREKSGNAITLESGCPARKSVKCFHISIRPAVRRTAGKSGYAFTSKQATRRTAIAEKATNSGFKADRSSAHIRPPDTKEKRQRSPNQTACPKDGRHSKSSHLPKNDRPAVKAERVTHSGVAE